MRPFFADQPPLAIAHRGSRLLWPENTMEAFQGAVDLGYRYLETDLHATADGILVAFHDDALDRTTDGSGPVRAHTWTQLTGLDAAHNFAPHLDYPRRGNGIRIPTLEELLTAMPETRLVLDVKEAGFEMLLADFLRTHDAEERVIVGSFSDVRLRRFRQASSGRVATSAGPAETTAVWMAARLGRPLRTHADALQIPEEFAFVRLADRKLVDVLEASGRQVHVWTVNDPENMARFLDNGVHGIITDRPDLLKQLMEARGEWKA